MEVNGKRVTVIGLGNSGLNAAMLLCERGARVWATDAGEGPVLRENAAKLEAAGARVELGRHTEAFVKGSDLVVVSPGVEESSPALRWAAAHHIPVIGEMELGFRFCQGRIIAVTGTNGKSTVTTLLGEILKAAGRDTVVCGNIGNSLCGEIVRIGARTWVVLEVSSFQLERTELFAPHIAIILNITEDHLDRYSSFDAYRNEKLKIFRRQRPDDWLVVNGDADGLAGLCVPAPSQVREYSRLKKTGGAYLDGGEIVFADRNGPQAVLPVTDIRITGVHNIENVLACVLAASLADIEPAPIREAVRSFRGLPHRVETVAVVDGVEYIDDSKGTTVDSTRRALEGFDGKVILIAGGRDKMGDYRAARETIAARVKHLILIGEAAARMREAYGDVVDTRQARDMDEAVRMAHTLAGGRTPVILSPMCSSFDMFRDYAHRADAFRAAVRSVDRATVREGAPRP